MEAATAMSSATMSARPKGCEWEPALAATTAAAAATYKAASATGPHDPTSRFRQSQKDARLIREDEAKIQHAMRRDQRR